MWFLYFGRRIGMTKAEILVTDMGEMYDMIACGSVVEGGAELEEDTDFFSLLNLL